MQLKIFCGTIKKCNYTGYVSNTLGNIHNMVVEESVYFVKVCDNGYTRLDELLSDNAKPQVFKRYLPSIGEYFVDDLVLVKEIVPIIKSVYNGNLDNSKKKRKY